MHGKTAGLLMASIGRKNRIEEAFRRRRFKGLVAFDTSVPRPLPPFSTAEKSRASIFSGISERAIVNGLETIFASVSSAAAIPFSSRARVLISETFPTKQSRGSICKFCKRCCDECFSFSRVRG